MNQNEIPSLYALYEQNKQILDKLDTFKEELVEKDKRISSIEQHLYGVNKDNGINKDVQNLQREVSSLKEFVWKLTGISVGFIFLLSIADKLFKFFA